MLPPIDVCAWLRVSSIFQGQNPSKINDWHMDSAYGELHAGGKIHKKVGVTLNLNADTTVSGGTAAIEDAIVSFDFVDEFHLWAGHLLVPVDRANASGPFPVTTVSKPSRASRNANGSAIDSSSSTIRTLGIGGPPAADSVGRPGTTSAGYSCGYARR